MNNDYKAYTGDDVEVKFHAKRCIHAAECVKGLPQVFDVQKRPWITPDNARADAIAQVIERCPSGALEYIRKDGGPNEKVNKETVITSHPDNILFVHGNITIMDGNEAISVTRASLCGCGESGNKPFCDQSSACKT